MRFAILAVIAIGCGGRASPAAGVPPAAAAFPAARWVPASPSYLLVSPTVADAQRSLRDAVELVGLVAGFDLRDVVAAASGVLGVDVLHPEPLAAIGVDPGGSWTMFSDELYPTVVVHLTAPDRMVAFLDHQRGRGLVTRSVIVSGTEVFSATLLGAVTVSWAIAGDWMWLHVAPAAAPDDGARWFAASHEPHDAGWVGDWAWAQRAAGAASGLIGLLDVHGAVARVAARLPAAAACARLAEPVGRLGLAMASDDHHVTARITADVGSTARLLGMILPPPSGWDATAATAALAVQWNLDVTAARAWLAPCLAAAGGALAGLDDTGVRAARAMLVGFDPDAVSGSGAIALDLASTAFIERQLDRVPLRRQLERARTFGPYQGFSISIPFSVTVEYVVAHGLALAALGDGLLARIVAPVTQAAPGAARPPALASLDVAPPAMSARAWAAVLHAIAAREISSLPGAAIERSVVDRAVERAVDRLARWRALHLAVTAEPGEIVLGLSGDRR